MHEKCGLSKDLASFLVSAPKLDQEFLVEFNLVAQAN